LHRKRKTRANTSKNNREIRNCWSAGKQTEELPARRGVKKWKSASRRRKEAALARSENNQKPQRPSK